MEIIDNVKEEIDYGSAAYKADKAAELILLNSIADTHKVSIKEAENIIKEKSADSYWFDWYHSWYTKIYDQFFEYYEPTVADESNIEQKKDGESQIVS